MTGPEAARRLIASSALRRIGEIAGTGEVFLTGGSLRDRLLGLPTHDFDLSVRGDPRRAAVALAGAVGGRCFPLGRPPLATWRVAGGAFQLDVWGIGSSVERDILRRDYTLNAIFWRLPRGPLLDLVGGLDDLAAGRIRVVRPENLTEDPLRILRGLRLLATHPRLRLTSDTERLLSTTARYLRLTAHERVCDELKKLLAGRAAARAVSIASRLGVLTALFPGWDGYAHTAELSRLTGGLQLLRHGGHRGLARGAAEVAAAVLSAPAAGFPGEWQAAPAAAALVEVGWPSRPARRAAEAAALADRIGQPADSRWSHARELAAEAGDLLEPALAWAVARAARDGVGPVDPARALLAWRRRFAARPPLLDGEEIAEHLGLPPGAPRGEAVAALRLARARGEVRTPGQARAFLSRRPLR